MDPKIDDQPIESPSDIPTQPMKPQRTWPAILTLFLLAPLIGEGLSGSTPILMLMNPLIMFYQAGLYGSGAILVRELARRRGLGWGSILLLGMAYGVLEEALVVTSWFNPYWQDLNKLAYYGRFLDTSWVWAVELTIYHGVISITIPIMLVELLFPRLAQQAWLGKRGYRAFIALLTFVSLIGLIGFGFILAYIASKGHYTHPPLMYFGALLLAIGLVWSGLRYRPTVRSSTPSPKTAPGLWQLRILALLMTIAFFFTSWALPSIVLFALIPVLVFVLIFASSTRLIAHWARRTGWGAQHRLALVCWVCLVCFLLSPIIEFNLHRAGKISTGQTLFGLLFLVGLIVLAILTRRRVKMGMVL